METKITDNSFKFGTNKYFRGNSINIELCSYGDKHDPIGARAYIDVENKVQSEHLKGMVKTNTVAEIDWNGSKKSEVEAQGVLKYFVVGVKAAFTGDYEKAKTAKLKLINFAIDAGPLKGVLNDEADGARKYLAREGKDGRIASEIWTLVDGKLADHFKSATTFSVGVNAAGNGIDVTASGGKEGSQTVTLSKGTTFAYKLHKVKEWNDDKTKIKDLEADWKGMD